MKFGRRLAAIAAGGLTLFASSAVSAAIMLATYTGTVASGFDTTGVFGSANNDLTGAVFVATVKYDTSLGNRSTWAGRYDLLDGGLDSGFTSPILSSTLMILGAKETIAASYSTAIGVFDDFDFKIVYHYGKEYSESAGYTISKFTDFAMYPSSAPTSLLTPFYGVSGGPSAEYSYGTFDFYEASDGAGVIKQASGLLTLESVTISPVPEPATWAMMIVGFGLAGGALRGARRDQAHAV